MLLEESVLPVYQVHVFMTRQDERKIVREQPGRVSALTREA